MDFLKNKEIVIRNMKIEDAQIMYDTYASYGWHPNLHTYITYFEEQTEGKRKVFVAEYRGEVAGLCTLVYHPEEGPFGNKDIPEIVDLCVFFHLHRLGIASKLMDACEKEASKVSHMVYLAVGVHSGYGPAQRMYIKRGYLPDGSGVWYQGQILGQYENCCNDDDLVLFLSKQLS